MMATAYESQSQSTLEWARGLKELQMLLVEVIIPLEVVKVLPVLPSGYTRRLK